MTEQNGELLTGPEEGFKHGPGGGMVFFPDFALREALTASVFLIVLLVLAAVLLWVATIAASALDGVGGIPFLRSVRVHERAEMSGVYRTYLDFSELLPNVIFSVALLMMPISGVFIILAVWLVLAGWVSWRYLPRSM